MSGQTLLLIDDDDLLSEMLASLLELEGYQVVTTADGQAGLDALAGKARTGLQFDLVILDLVMPRMDGIRFLRLLPSHVAAPPPVLVMSASVNAELMGQVNSPFVIGWARKPMQPRELIDQVARALSGP